MAARRVSSLFGGPSEIAAEVQMLQVRGPARREDPRCFTASTGASAPSRGSSGAEISKKVAEICKGLPSPSRNGRHCPYRGTDLSTCRCRPRRQRAIAIRQPALAGAEVQSNSWDNRLVHRRGPHLTAASAPRCRLRFSWRCRGCQGSGCSPAKKRRELGSYRSDTGRLLSAGPRRGDGRAGPRTRGAGRPDRWCKGATSGEKMPGAIKGRTSRHVHQVNCEVDDLDEV